MQSNKWAWQLKAVLELLRIKCDIILKWHRWNLKLNRSESEWTWQLHMASKLRAYSSMDLLNIQKMQFLVQVIRKIHTTWEQQVVELDQAKHKEAWIITLKCISQSTITITLGDLLKWQHQISSLILCKVEVNNILGITNLNFRLTL